MKTLGELRKWMEDNRWLGDEVPIRVDAYEWDGNFELIHKPEQLPNKESIWPDIREGAPEQIIIGETA